MNLLPTKGAWVTRKDGQEQGIVQDVRVDNKELCVKWLSSQQREWITERELRSGLQVGMEVQDVPYSRTRGSLGVGKIIATRCIGLCDQALVEFSENGSRVWLPYQNLRRVKGVEARFLSGETEDPERFRLKSLAYALEMWQENTGSLSRLDIDPLPHQIHLVHHILRSGNLNWLIGDDVGLGKTIEVGMLLSALEARGTFRRILIVTPSGLVRQWQEELHHKFGMSDYQIYGTDFQIHQPHHWKMYDHVIGSMDLFKREEHIENLLRAGNWDLIVFDESHRLSRRQWGNKLEASERFQLAAKLRKTTDALLLLSGTPHQGKQDKFQALLELLRPELRSEIQALSLNPEIIREMVIRNHKADVTDAEGNFIFQGTLTRTVQVPENQNLTDFDAKLKTYLLEGYEAGRRLGHQGLAIGFVMTVYRKLAASSIYAIRSALEKRLAKLLGVVGDGRNMDAMDAIVDDRFAGEQEEIFDLPDNTFFDGEIDMLRALIAQAQVVEHNDEKLQAFLDVLLPQVGADKKEKVIIFTEYRNTQNYLQAALGKKYGDDQVCLIHGGQSFTERETSIAEFESRGRFLISTEAGGEGLNLHRNCHVMINYDLPWNPMRIVQRVGRLYRYGQKKKVVVFNLLAPNTFDTKILHLMYERIGQVVQDMAPVSQEFNQGFQDEILGELIDMLDVEAVLEEATQMGIQRTQARIEEALKKAQDAARKQRELLAFAAGFDGKDLAHHMPIDLQHVRAFVEGMVAVCGIEVVGKSFEDRVWDLKLPEDMQALLPGKRQVIRISFDRDIARRNANVEMMDFNAPFFKYLIDQAKSMDFGGLCAQIRGLHGKTIFTAMLRWQNDQGRRMRQEYVALLDGDTGEMIVNPPTFAQWLLTPAASEGGVSYNGCRKEVDRAKQVLDRQLAKSSNAYLHPESREFVNAGWCDANGGSK